MLLQALCFISSPYVNSNWSYSLVTAKLGFDLCDLDLDLWPWPLAWTSLLSMVITPENFMMVWWQEHGEKRCDRQTDGRRDRQTERSVLRAAWSQLKIYLYVIISKRICLILSDHSFDWHTIRTFIQVDVIKPLCCECWSWLVPALAVGIVNLVTSALVGCCQDMGLTLQVAVRVTLFEGIHP